MQRLLILSIRERQLHFLGHVTSKARIKKLLLTEIEEKIARGRQRETILDGTARWLQRSKPNDTK